jgi:hypothetical protein
MVTPIPVGADRRIDELAVQLAACRDDLTAESRHMLARSLAYRCRSYRRDQHPVAIELPRRPAR